MKACYILVCNVYPLRVSVSVCKLKTIFINLDTKKMKSKYKLIVFDLDGTLLSTVQDVHACVNEALILMQLAPITIEKAMTAIGPRADDFALIIVGSNNKHRYEEFLGIFRPLYLQNCSKNTAPFPEITQLLKAVREHKLAIATNKPVAMSIHILNKCSLLKYFHYIVGPEMVQNGKPHPDMLTYLLHICGVAPDQALMVGDTENDLLAGKAAYFKTCFVEWGYSPDKEKLKRVADFHIANPLALLKILNELKGGIE
jgi:phosphoglycolate phosphatase